MLRFCQVDNNYKLRFWTRDKNTQNQKKLQEKPKNATQKRNITKRNYPKQNKRAPEAPLRTSKSRSKFTKKCCFPL